MKYLDLQKEDDLAVIYLDASDSAINTLSTTAVREFEDALETLEKDDDIRAAILYSNKKDFIVGADIQEFAGFESPEQVKGILREGHALLNSLENLKKPVVVAVHGAALGGGLELILACHYRLASDDPRTKFGLPEVNLGLLPGLGGTQRLTNLVGPQKALELILTGKNVYPKQAREMGLVDATIHRYGLLDGAKRAARGLVEGSVKPRRKKKSIRNRVLEDTPLNRIVYDQAGKNVQKTTRGNYPAPEKIIPVVRTGQEKGTQAGLEAETEAFAELVFTPESKSLRHLFFAKNAAEKNPYEGQEKEVVSVGVLGAGLMGSGIAQISAQARHEVFLKDADLELAAKGKGTIWKNLSKRVGKGFSLFERDVVAERVTPVEDYATLKDADLVIEAVPESVELKRQMLADVEAAGKDELVFATNTSAIPIKEVAEGSGRPDQVVGMHYFSPAQKIPLLEIVKTDSTPDWVLATALAAGLAQGKTPIVVNDGPGFYTTRILGVYMNEALLMLEEGADLGELDEAMRDFGFPVGPIKLLDEVGIDVGAKINDVMRPLFDKRDIPLSTKGEEVVEAGYKGRKNGRGFYTYEGGKSKGVNEEIYTFFGGPERESLDAQSIQDRLSLTMINEAVRCLEKNVITSPTDGDVGAVFGLGFPPFLGGPFWYLDELGTGTVVEKLEKLWGEHGTRFEPAGLLGEHAEQEKKFYSK